MNARDFLVENPQVRQSASSRKMLDAAAAREAARKAREMSSEECTRHRGVAGKLADCQDKDPAHRETMHRGG